MRPTSASLHQAIPLALVLLVSACMGHGVPFGPAGQDSSPSQETADSAGTDSHDSSGNDSLDSSDTTDTTDSGDSTDSPVETGDSGPVLPDHALVSDVTVTVHDQVSTILIVTWNQEEAVEGGWLEFTFEDDEWFTSPEKPLAAGPQREVILGVPSETTVQFHICNRYGDQVIYSKEEYSGTTGSLPAGFVEPTLISYDPLIASPERFMLGSVDMGSSWYYGPFWTFIVDRQARVVWYRRTSDSRLSLFVQVAADGTHILVDGSTYYVWDPSVEPSIERLTLDLVYDDDTVLPSYGFTFDEIDGGTILYQNGSDELVARDSSGSETTLWSCPTYARSAGFSAYTCMPNSIIWTPGVNTLLWSMFENDTVVEVDLDTRTVLRQFGQLPGSYTFDPPSSVLDYMHFPSWTPDGTLLSSTHVRGSPGIQREREYTVDDATETFTNVWTFGEDEDYYATYAGEAQRLADRNTLISYGTDGAVVEATYDMDVAWNFEWSDPRHTLLIGHLTLIDDLYALNEGPSAR
jgi:hypothetical protein